mgnify:CR=1 FL=1
MKVVIRMARNPDGSYRAWCPALPGCMVRAATKQEAQDRIMDAVAGYLSSLDVVMPRELEGQFRGAVHPVTA